MEIWGGTGCTPNDAIVFWVSYCVLIAADPGSTAAFGIYLEWNYAENFSSRTPSFFQIAMDLVDDVCVVSLLWRVLVRFDERMSRLSM